MVFVVPSHTQICSLPQRETLSLVSKAVCSTNILKRSFKQNNCKTCRNVMENGFPINTSAWNSPLSHIYMAFFLISPGALFKCHLIRETLPNHLISFPTLFLFSFFQLLTLCDVVVHMNLILCCLSLLLKCKLRCVQNFVLFTAESSAPKIVPDRVNDH